MTVGSYDAHENDTYSAVTIIFKSEKTGNEETYGCYLGDKRANLTEVQQKATPTKATCQPFESNIISCKFKDKISCQEATDQCVKKLEGKYFRSVLPNGPCPEVRS